MERIFSGIQPTGELHLGNYLGAVRNWVRAQEDYECIFCVVDYHAITIPYDAAQMLPRIYDLSCGLIACGIDPPRLRRRRPDDRRPLRRGAVDRLALRRRGQRADPCGRRGVFVLRPSQGGGSARMRRWANLTFATGHQKQQSSSWASA